MRSNVKSVLAVLCQVAVVLFGLAILAFLLWEPHIEGRNAHATFFQIYFQDPFLAYVYLGSVPFFLALRRAFGLFGNFRREGVFSAESVDALRAIRRWAVTLIGFVVGAAVWILLFGDREDRPAGIFMSLLVTLGASVVAVVAALAARKLRSVLERAAIVRT